MLTVEEEARDYLFVLLDHIRTQVPEGTCFRLTWDGGQPILCLSHEEDADDEVSEYEGRTVLVWNPVQFPSGRRHVLEVDEDDLDEQMLLLTRAEPNGIRSETVVELDEKVHDILAKLT